MTIRQKTKTYAARVKDANTMLVGHRTMRPMTITVTFADADGKWIFRHVRVVGNALGRENIRRTAVWHEVDLADAPDWVQRFVNNPEGS